MAKLSVTTGKLKDPPKIVIYGPGGVGKTTLAVSAPDAILCDIDGGSGQINCARFTYRPGDGGTVPTSYDDVLRGLRGLLADEHDFRTAVFDGLDRLENLIFQKLCAEHSRKQTIMNKGAKPINSIEDFPFGKGYTLALDEWRFFLRLVDDLRFRRGMTVILVGHSFIRMFKNPEGEDYDRIGLRIRAEASAYIREWSDMTVYMAFEEFGQKIADSDARAKGTSTGRRVLRTEYSAAVDAKSRWSINRTIDVGVAEPWQPLAQAMALTAAPAADIKEAIAAELARIGDGDLAGKVNALLAQEQNPDKLGRWLHNLRSRPAIQKSDSDQAPQVAVAEEAKAS